MGGDTLSMDQSLSVGQTLVSQGSIFELGFFSTSTNTYLGIWYKSFTAQIIVWVANTEQMFSYPSSANLAFSRDGNLVLLTNFSRNQIWSTNFVSPTPNFTEAVLQDDGNFVVRNVINPSKIYWQSFDHPTDTLLSGAKLGINKHTGKTQVLTSWKNSEDPTPGRYSFGIDPDERNQYFIGWNKSRRYWSTGVWNGDIFSSVPEWGNSLFRTNFISNENESYLTYSNLNTSVLLRFVMTMSGQLRIAAWFGGHWHSGYFWAQPLPGQVYDFCGTFGISKGNLSMLTCECLQGFEPYSIEDTKLNDWSDGCVRKTPLQCQNGTYTNGMTDRFLKIQNIKLPENSIVLLDRSLSLHGKLLLHSLCL
ncbi:G-type lectin S-receptor-like serine/threonine-protein kinase At2g19130 [Cornus florida]|uniref:G-type lectin S-receptor-like serine/threonine-protein kinase At2g19130 n=1 Tax=Cornus florida TaxID=4283 RepID=UPI0028A1F89A|nr:G-type lectin S-receptor-like serine/threonine-protein kinase At2g19130 [Cornus florida]